MLSMPTWRSIFDTDPRSAATPQLGIFTVALVAALPLGNDLRRQAADVLKSLILKAIFGFQHVQIANWIGVVGTVFIKPIIKFIRTIRRSITVFITFVAVHEVLH